MERTKKELMQEMKNQAPEVYEEILTDSEKEFAEGGYCFGNQSGFGGGNSQGGRWCAQGGRGQGRGGRGQGQGGHWGGRRCGAGRPRMFSDRKTISKQISVIAIDKIKKFAESNNISENESLEKLVNAGYENLMNQL